VKKILQNYEGKVRLVIKHMPYKYRDFAFISAEATLAAGEQGKFWEMHWLLHVKFPKLDRDSLISYAEELGLDMKQFKKDQYGAYEAYKRGSAALERPRPLQHPCVFYQWYQSTGKQAL
jgi:protein-disulfide isomerase